MPSIGPFPSTLVALIATVLIGFLLGLELHSYRREAGPDLGFGTTRTLTSIAILGFALWLLGPQGVLYCVGLAVLAALLGIYYLRRTQEGKLSLLPTIVALLVYGLGPIAQTQPLWFFALYVVTIIVMLGEQPGIRRLSDAFPGGEGVTLAKFFIMLGVVLPLLPADKLGPLFGNLTYHQIWLAVVAVSAISYLSYLAQRYFFPERGLLLTAALGGLYSSTAVTVVLSRRAHGNDGAAAKAAPAIVLATAMMYLRLWTIILVFGRDSTAAAIAVPFVPAFLGTLAFAYLLQRRVKPQTIAAADTPIRNPLELPTALFFALLLVLFVVLAGYALDRFGTQGLSALSVLAGFGDVDAFVVALLTGKFAVTNAMLASAMVLATGSNNLLKAGCAAVLGRNRKVLPAVIWLAALFVASVVYAGVAAWAVP